MPSWELAADFSGVTFVVLCFVHLSKFARLWRARFFSSPVISPSPAISILPMHSKVIIEMYTLAFILIYILASDKMCSPLYILAFLFLLSWVSFLGVFFLAFLE